MLQDTKMDLPNSKGTVTLAASVSQLMIVSGSSDRQIIVWDYSDGVIIRKIPVSGQILGVFTAEGRNKSLFLLVSINNRDNECLFVKQEVVPRKTGALFDTSIFTNCSKDRKMVAVGPEASYFVRLTRKNLNVKKNNSNQTFSFTTDNNMMCVACHPRDLCIATGCKDGQILLWFNFLSNSEARSVIHWHSLPVRHLTFTAEGSYLLSGGHECVLVKWHHNTQYKDFRPRLGAPINDIVCSSDNTLFATTHDNNVIHVISSNFEIEHIFQGLTRGHLKSKKLIPVVTGLLYDPRSRSLVLSGRPGHLQFYSVQEDKHLFNLDIVQQNYVSPENLQQPLCVTEVTGAAFDSGGTWLATAEYWNDGVMSPEIRLKFWQFDEEKQSYVLNTSVDLPHDQKIASLKFRPHFEASSPGTEPMLVTSSADGKFKTWLLVDDTDIYRKNTKWNCDSVGYYQDLPASKVSFSNDGSLLAVVFGSRITLWEPEICLLKHTLAQNIGKKEVRYIEFGCHHCSQYLVSCTSYQLVVWNLVTCTVSWSVDIRVTALVADPLSENIAVFTLDRELFVFKPSSPNPVFSHVAVSKINILSGIFIPQSQKNLYGQTTLAWQNGSQLYFMNEEQELRTVSFETENSTPKEKQDLVTFEQNLPQTALSLIVTGQGRGKTSEEVKIMQKSVPRQPSGSYLKEMLESASHTLPSVTALCQPFLNSLLINKKQHSSKKGLEDDEEDEEMNGIILSPWQQSQTATTDSGLESDMEIDSTHENPEKAQLSLSHSSVDQGKSRLIKIKPDPAVAENLQNLEELDQFIDADITDLLAFNTDWYSSWETSKKTAKKSKKKIQTVENTK